MHQIVWQRLIYRFDDGARQEFTSITRPSEGNRRVGKVTAVGTYGTLPWRIQSDVEQDIVISAALNVSSMSSLHL